MLALGSLGAEQLLTRHVQGGGRLVRPKGGQTQALTLLPLPRISAHT